MYEIDAIVGGNTSCHGRVMEGLVQYDSDEDRPEYQSRRNDGSRRLNRPSSGSSKKQEDDTNYDDVTMDMSEDSNSPSESQHNDRSNSPPSQRRKSDSSYHKKSRNSPVHSSNNYRSDDRHQKKSPPRSGRSHDSDRHAESKRDKYDDQESNSKDSLSKRYDGDNKDRKDSRDNDRERHRDDRHRENSHHWDKERRRERSRSNDRRKRSDSRDKDRSSRHNRRSHSRERRRRSRSHERNDKKQYHAYRVNKKLQVMEKMGLQIKTPDGEMTSAQSLQRSIAEGDRVRSEPGMEVPKYYNPNAVNSMRFAEQVQKRKLLWNKPKEQATADVGETSNQQKPSLLDKWQGTKFAQDSDGKVTSKFLRLMGVKDPAVAQVPQPEKPSTEDLVHKQDEMFQGLQAQYDVARATTHTMRGVGLGFNRQY